MGSIEVRPVTEDNWQDFVRLFEAKGSPHYCWCAARRVPAFPNLTNLQKKTSMRRVVDAGTPIGVLAYRGGEPVGWCSVAPRETYVRLTRSRAMARATPVETPTWTILCFFVARPHRHQGVTHALMKGAVAYAKERGAKVIEGYPFDTAEISSTHRGHSRMFKAVHFRRDGKRWFRSLGAR